MIRKGETETKVVSVHGERAWRGSVKNVVTVTRRSKLNKEVKAKAWAKNLDIGSPTALILGVALTMFLLVAFFVASKSTDGLILVIAITLQTVQTAH
jgi:hypothetical protein